MDNNPAKYRIRLTSSKYVFMIKNITQKERDETLIIVPVYNEGAHIGKVVSQIKHIGYKHILVVDDGSWEDPAPHLKQYDIHVVRHAINRGQGAAIQTGLDYCKSKDYHYAVTFDGDEQFKAQDIDTVLGGLIMDRTDICIGNRFMMKNDIPVIRRLYNFIAKIVTYLLSGLLVNDSQSGFKAFTKEAISKIDLHTSGYEFCTELIREIAHHKLSFNEVPVRVSYTLDSMKKGQNFAGVVKTVFKLFIRSLMN